MIARIPAHVGRDGAKLTLRTGCDLVLTASTGAYDGVLDDFYGDYDKAFILSSEKEGYGGFVRCLELNAGRAYEGLATRFGAFREYVLTVSDVVTGARIGGANLIAYPISSNTAVADAVLVINLNYVFINAASRGQGYFRRLIRDLPLATYDLFRATYSAELPASWSTAGDAPPTFMFIEQNDPLRMPADDYARDTELTGLDQLARIGIWARLGAKIIDFDYVQPALSSAQAPDENLVLAVMGASGEGLSACLLRQHLLRFFAISVLKGGDPLTDPTAGPQLAELQRLCNEGRQVSLLAAANLAGAPGAATSLRSYLSRARGP
jgi:hypothetical protein